MSLRLGLRRGAYAPLFAILGSALVGFGAIAVDLSTLRLADAELQAVADASAYAAILQLRRTSDPIAARSTAEAVIANNRVAGVVATPLAVEVGAFDKGVFIAQLEEPSAVRVEIEVQVETPFSGFWGDRTRTMTGMATAAVRPLHAVVALDITNSWGSDFSGARDGCLEIFDQLTGAASDLDRIGLATFHNKYGVEYTPLQPTIHARAKGIREDWENLRTAYRTEVYCNGDDALAETVASDGLPEDCDSDVPYEFSDERGTDHAIGVLMATTMFAEEPDPNVYRALIIVTDGEPAYVGEAEERWDLGFEDDRWRFVFADGPGRSPDQIRAETQLLADAAWRDSEVHVWLVSYRQDGAWLYNVPQGDGYFVLARQREDLEEIFRDIGESLPVTLVQ